MELPNHFTDEEILRAQRVALSVGVDDDEIFIRAGPRNRGAYSLTMGLLMRLNTGASYLFISFIIFMSMIS